GWMKQSWHDDGDREEGGNQGSFVPPTSGNRTHRPVSARPSAPAERNTKQPSHTPPPASDSARRASRGPPSNSAARRSRSYPGGDRSLAPTLPPPPHRAANLLCLAPDAE